MRAKRLLWFLSSMATYATAITTHSSSNMKKPSHMVKDNGVERRFGLECTGFFF